MHRRFCCLALAGGLLAAAGFFDMAEAQSISFDKRTWSGELSFDDPKYAEAISVNPTATLEFSIDDRGKVLGTVEIAGSRDKYRGVLGGGLSGSELALSATLQTTADLPTSDERAQWLVKSSRMPLKLIGRVVAAGGESRVEGSGTLDLFSPDCVVGAIMSERLIDCPKRPVAMIWRATGPAGAGDIGSEPEHRTATVELQRQREQNREREAAIPEDCRVEVLEVTGVVEIVPHGPPGPANPEIAEPLASGKQGLGAIPLNQGSRYICDTDTLYTGLESGAVLRLRDGTIVTVGESADLKPRKPEPGELPDQTKTRLWLETGRIEAELTKPQPAAMDLQVKTPTATLSRRGTTFTVAHTDKPEPRTTVTVSKGVVEVIPDNPALDIAWVRPGGEVQVTQTEVVPAGNVNLERRLPAATQDSVALAEPPGEGPVKNGHPPSAEPPGEGPIKNGHPASVEPEAEAPKNGNPALAQAADGHMAGPESESGPTNGHGPGPGMDVPTNGAPAPTREGVESEAGPQAYPAPAPQGAIPQVSQPPRCDIAGQWRMDTANVGQSTWTFTPAGSGSYAGVEQGLGNATGTAVMNGNSMQLQWSTGGYSGVVELSIDPSCSAGQGQHIFYSGRAGSESTRWTRIATAPVPAPAAATGGDAGGDFVGPAPSPIKLHAVIGGVDITAVLIRTGPDSWEWVESGNTFRFRPLLDSSDQLVIYDRSRDMFHRLNFKTAETAWRVGKLGGGNGNWNPHYTIVR